MRIKGVYSSQNRSILLSLRYLPSHCEMQLLHVMPLHLGGRRRAACASVSREGNKLYCPSAGGVTAQLS